MLAQQINKLGTLVIYNFETQEKHEIENVPIYDGATCNFSGFYDDTYLVVDNIDNRDPSNIQNKRHVVNITTGDVIENTLFYEKDGAEKPVQILADAEDSLLVVNGFEQRMIAALDEGVNGSV